MGNILEKIRILSSKLRHPVKLMELCGTHSQTVAKYNLKSLLPQNIELISGPGCPICVTDQTDIDIVIGLAENDIPIAIYGDALSLPGTNSSLEKLKQQGKKIHIVYSTQDAINIQKHEPDLVFFGIGFETTTPMTAWAIKQGIKVYSAHKLFPPAMAALLQNPNIKIGGFINPGHVSAIIGTKPYEQFNVPQVISGFEPEDVLISIQMLLEMIVNNQNIVKNQFQNQDAEYIHKDLIEKIKQNILPKQNQCICGKILQGLAKPSDCPLFAKACTPENPQGACMVSVEGNCQIEYRFNNQSVGG